MIVLSVIVAGLAVGQLILWIRLSRIRSYDGPPAKDLQDAVIEMKDAMAQQSAAIAVIKANRAEGPS